MGRRGDFNITAPTFFKCPISLEVMRSPVSLCTGVTYDRSSIQRWLDDGNNTCPATMQVLHSKEVVPNHTLQRLIQIWSASLRPPDAVSPEDITDILSLVDSSDSPLEALLAVRSFALVSEENRVFLAGLPELLPLLADMLDGRDISVAEVVVVILDSLRSRIRGRQEMMLLATSNCLFSLVEVLRKGSDELERAAAARVIESMAFDGMVAEHDIVVRGLVWSIAEDPDPGVVEASLSSLITFCSFCKRVKVELVSLKVVPLLKNLLERNVGVVEKTMELMGILSSCKEGREDLCREVGCVEAVVGKLMKVSLVATEHAVTVLWAACCMAKDEMAMKAMTKSNGVAKVLLLLQGNCSPAAKHMLSQLLRVATSSSANPLPSYDTKTIHVMPF